MSSPTRNPKKATDDPLLAIIEPALNWGAISAGTGFLFGGTAGILKSTTPKLFALASAIQCGTLGASFVASRGLILHAWDTPKQTPSDRSKASAIAGGLSGGACGFIFRGRSNVIPGALVMGLAGYAGQAWQNWRAAIPVTPQSENPRRGFWESMTSIGVVTHLSDEQYAEMLRERLLKVDVEIAVLDDKIAAIKKDQAVQVVPEKQESEK